MFRRELEGPEHVNGGAQGPTRLGHQQSPPDPALVVRSWRPRYVEAARFVRDSMDSPFPPRRCHPAQLGSRIYDNTGHTGPSATNFLPFSRGSVVSTRTHSTCRAG